MSDYRKTILGLIRTVLREQLEHININVKNTQTLEDALKSKKKVILFQKLEFKEPEPA